MFPLGPSWPCGSSAFLFPLQWLILLHMLTYAATLITLIHLISIQLWKLLPCLVLHHKTWYSNWSTTVQFACLAAVCGTQILNTKAIESMNLVRGEYIVFFLWLWLQFIKECHIVKHYSLFPGTSRTRRVCITWDFMFDNWTCFHIDGTYTCSLFFVSLHAAAGTYSRVDTFKTPVVGLRLKVEWYVYAAFFRQLVALRFRYMTIVNRL
jgi:hypothetical protein